MAWMDLRVAPVGVVALPVPARIVLALVLVVLARGPRESRGAGALVRIADGCAFGAVATWLRGAVVLLLAVFS